MSKLLLLLVVVLAIFWLLRSALGGRRPENGPAPQGPADPATADLVKCAHCGVLLPLSEALESGEATASGNAKASGESGTPEPGRFFCTKEHLRLGPR